MTQEADGANENALGNTLPLLSRLSQSESGGGGGMEEGAIDRFSWLERAHAGWRVFRRDTLPPIDWRASRRCRSSSWNERAENGQWRN